MSILDSNLDITSQDIINVKCKRFVGKMFRIKEEYADKYFEVIWGNIQPENLINHPERYGIAIKNMYEAESGEISYIRICRIGSYYQEFLPVKGLKMSKILNL